MQMAIAILGRITAILFASMIASLLQLGVVLVLAMSAVMPSPMLVDPLYRHALSLVICIAGAFYVWDGLSHSAWFEHPADRIALEERGLIATIVFVFLIYRVQYDGRAAQLRRSRAFGA